MAMESWPNLAECMMLLDAFASNFYLSLFKYYYGNMSWLTNYNLPLQIYQNTNIYKSNYYYKDIKMPFRMV